MYSLDTILDDSFKIMNYDRTSDYIPAAIGLVVLLAICCFCFMAGAWYAKSVMLSQLTTPYGERTTK